jgi:His-Xaa-Ser system protein HxsD
VVAEPSVEHDEILDLRVYSLTAVKKAAYRGAARCTVVIGSPDGDRLPVRFAFRPGTSASAAQEAVRRFHEDLVDEDLRERLNAETAPLRGLILAHAFSRTDLRPIPPPARQVHPPRRRALRRHQ